MNMMQINFVFVNQYRASRGIIQTPEETFNDIMSMPNATYLGNGWFALYEQIEEGQASNLEAP